MALSGVKGLMAAFKAVQERLNGELRILALVPSRVDRTRLAREVVASLRDRFGDLVSQTVIRQSIRLAEAPSHRRPITEYAMGSHAAEDFLALAAELESKLKLTRYAHASA
jgi:chromosome partitioning protein